MSKPIKILIGLATCWPVIYLGVFFFAVFSTLPSTGAGGGAPPGDLFSVILPLHLITMLWIVGLTVFYIVDVFRNRAVTDDKRVLWAVVLFMGNMISMPIYWYLYIWREPTIPDLG
jgi:hypothetical protein